MALASEEHGQMPNQNARNASAEDKQPSAMKGQAGVQSPAPTQKSKPAAPPVEPFAYDIAESCRRDGIGRSTKYLAINPDPTKRSGLPYLPSFTVGRRRLMLAADHQAWLEKLKALTAAADQAA
jgi:hypothetical protein